MRRVVIVEDETAAAVNLRNMLTSLIPDVEIVEVLESVEESVEFFSGEVDADVVFMDIHLADGDSFRIFQSVDISIPIIFTTAYDEYALEAFKVNSIDYILKPIKQEDLIRAIEKLANLSGKERGEYKERVDTMVESSKKESQRVFLVHYKDKIIPLSINDIAFFYTANEKVSAFTFAGEKYQVDRTLEMLQSALPADEFFRANRQYIVARKAVKWFGSRLALNLTQETPEKIIISKARVPEFKQWLMAIHPAN